MNLTTFASRATTAVVAGVAGFSSYRHIVEVAQRAGEHHAVAAVLPLSIDGLIVVGTMAMVEDRRAGRKARLSARVALVVGVIATLAANIASAQPHATARLVAAVPAVAFLITVEVLARTGRIRAAEADSAAAVVQPVEQPPAAGAPWSRAIEQRRGRVSHRRKIRTVRVTHPAARESAVQDPPVDPRETHEIEAVVRAVKSADPKLSQRKIARLVGVTQPTVGRILRRGVTQPPAVNGRVPAAEEVAS